LIIALTASTVGLVVECGDLTAEFLDSSCDDPTLRNGLELRPMSTGCGHPCGLQFV
jgi:hypothetical protein